MLYLIETPQGMLEVTKGAYLTMLRRKCCPMHTLTKHKLISSQNMCKKTVKKIRMKNPGRHLEKKPKQKTVLFQDRKKKMHQFNLEKDSEVFDEALVLPSIDVEYDNDNESEWPQISDHINHLKLSLSLAVFDRMACQCK